MAILAVPMSFRGKKKSAAFWQHFQVSCSDESYGRLHRCCFAACCYHHTDRNNKCHDISDRRINSMCMDNLFELRPAEE